MRKAQEILNDAQMLNNQSTMPSPFEIQKLAQENEALVNFYHAKTPLYTPEDKEQLGIAVQTFEALLKYCNSPLYMVKMTYFSGLANQMQGKYRGFGEATDCYNKALRLMKVHAPLHPEIHVNIPESRIRERIKEMHPFQSTSVKVNNTPDTSVARYHEASSHSMQQFQPKPQSPIIPLEIASDNTFHK